MKKIAIILASGVGHRMKCDIPKQFVSVKIDYGNGYIEEKEVLTYTLEAFQNHECVDEICIVTLDEYKEHVMKQVIDYGITKVKNIICGGETVQESIRNGIYCLDGYANPEDIIIIHDGVRPFVDEEILIDVVETCIKKGNAVTSLPYNEQIFIIDEDNPNVTNKYINRDKIRRVSTPQAYNYNIISNAYHRAFSEKIGIYPPSYTNNMMVDLGYTLNFASGSERNIKLTTPPDITTFIAYKKEEYNKKKQQRIKTFKNS